jgi:hypothetical protein
MRLLWSTSATALACAALLTTGTATGQDGTTAPGQLLPDLDQQTPNGLTMARSGSGRKRRFWLGFQSAVRNIGDGALNLAGERTSTKTPDMKVQQLIDRGDGGQDVVPTTDRMRYAISPDHRHWHLLKFDRYTLRRAGSRSAAVRDQKTGFCLGDRYRVDPSVPVPAAPPQPAYTSRCGLGETHRLTMQEGISPGYGDNYQAYLEGQSLELTGLKPGRYVLAHTANGDHALLESNYGNNSASLLLDVRWRSNRPVVTTVASCPDTDRCDDPPAVPAARRDRVAPSSHRLLLCPLARARHA